VSNSFDEAFSKNFFAEIAIADLQAADSLIQSEASYCMADVGKAYVIYRNGKKKPANFEIDQRGTQGKFSVQWLDPVTDGSYRQGSIPTVEGGSVRNLGSPSTSDRPSDSKDWVINLANLNSCPFFLQATILPGNEPKRTNSYGRDSYGRASS
jgi:hypothetical protein